jgi:hypothetical protein
MFKPEQTVYFADIDNVRVVKATYKEKEDINVFTKTHYIVLENGESLFIKQELISETEKMAKIQLEEAKHKIENELRKDNEWVQVLFNLFVENNYEAKYYQQVMKEIIKEKLEIEVE